MCLSHLGKVFTIFMAEIGSWIIVVLELVTLQVLCHWSKNNSPMVKFSTKCWIFLEFPDCGTIFFLYTVWRLLSSRIITGDMFMPLPANSLMQSAWHVTAHICMVTPAAQITDDTAFKHNGTLYILWLSMKMDVYTALKLILSKMVKPCLILSPLIQGTHLLLL